MGLPQARRSNDIRAVGPQRARNWPGRTRAGFRDALECAPSARPVAGSCLTRSICAALLSEPEARRSWRLGRTALRSTGRLMREILFFVISSFWAGAAHAATPG